MEQFSALLGHPAAQYYIAVFLIFIPVARSFERAGLSVWWTLLLGIPYFGIVAAPAVLALKRWPQAGGDSHAA